MIVSRDDVITQLEERLAGRISAEGLATWAFNLFYLLEQGEQAVAREDAEAIAVVLDELIFADDPSFALDELDLRQLIARLRKP